VLDCFFIDVMRRNGMTDKEKGKKEKTTAIVENISMAIQ
jgi:hypothetical protein